jgi:alpha-glucosidase (family GH31 glycosyl hydrolase)
VDLETMPLHVRAGSILPLGPVRQYVDQTVDGPMTLIVYPGADGAAVLYEDDGRSFDYRKGEAMKLEVAWRDRERTFAIRLASASRMRPPSPRRLVVRVAGSQMLRNVLFQGAPVEVRL